MAVILADYEAEVEALMKAAPGLKSRFSQKLHFPDFTPEAAVALVVAQCRKGLGLELDERAAEVLPALTAEVSRGELCVGVRMQNSACSCGGRSMLWWQPMAPLLVDAKCSSPHALAPPPPPPPPPPPRSLWPRLAGQTVGTWAPGSSEPLMLTR
jgi:hypothetical protein